ncbi:MAG: hypothetical protein MUE73_08975 [Planctomycetes bacterium]|nr:hypothetical protein [Planctomycetota bacterium]
MAGLADLPDLCARLSAALTAAGVPHAVSGALALGAHGYVRATRDIDILVLVPSIRLPEVFETVRGFGFRGEDRDLILALRERAVAELTAGPASVEILVPVLPYHREVLARARPVEVAGVPVPFVTAEDLVVLKMLWLRDKDRADVRGLLAAGRATLDRAWIRGKLAALLPAGAGVVETFDRLATEADPV